MDTIVKQNRERRVHYANYKTSAGALRCSVRSSSGIFGNFRQTDNCHGRYCSEMVRCFFLF